MGTSWAVWWTGACGTQSSAPGLFWSLLATKLSSRKQLTFWTTFNSKVVQWMEEFHMDSTLSMHLTLMTLQSIFWLCTSLEVTKIKLTELSSGCRVCRILMVVMQLSRKISREHGFYTSLPRPMRTQQSFSIKAALTSLVTFSRRWVLKDWLRKTRKLLEKLFLTWKRKLKISQRGLEDGVQITFMEPQQPWWGLKKLVLIWIKNSLLTLLRGSNQSKILMAALAKQHTVI